MLEALWVALLIPASYALSIQNVNVQGSSDGAASFTLNLGVNVNRDASDITSVDAALAIDDSTFFFMATTNLNGLTGLNQILYRIEQRSITSGNVYRVQFRQGGSTSGCGVPNGCSSLPGPVLTQSELFNVQEVFPFSSLLTDPNPPPTTPPATPPTTSPATPTTTPTATPPKTAPPGTTTDTSTISGSSTASSSTSASIAQPSQSFSISSSVSSQNGINTTPSSSATQSNGSNISAADTATSPNGSATNSSPSTGSKPVGAIAGGVIGGLVCLAVAGGFAFCLLRRSRAAKAKGYVDGYEIPRPAEEENGPENLTGRTREDGQINLEKKRGLGNITDTSIPLLGANGASFAEAIDVRPVPATELGAPRGFGLAVVSGPVIGAPPPGGFTEQTAVEDNGDGDELEQRPPEEIHQELRMLREEVRRFRTEGPTPDWLDSLPNDMPPPEYASSPDPEMRS